MRKVKIGIIGCGVISNTYIRDMKRFYTELEIAACADADLDRARACAERYGILAGCSVEELLEKKEVEIVVNLTPPQFHTEINKKILGAGKHLFCEKPFALNVREASEIMELAKVQGRKIGCAPDTFLGSALQTCRKLLDDGWIGAPLYVTANMMSAGVESWHPAPEPFYKQGAGPLYDMGPYYLTALAALMGPVKSVFARAGTGFKRRRIYSRPLAGQEIDVETPTHYSAVLELVCGVIVSLNISFDIWHSSLPMLEIYGTEGTLQVPDPNLSGGSPKVYRMERSVEYLYGSSDEAKEETAESREGKQGFQEIPELYPHIGSYIRGSGVLDLARSITEQREQRATSEMARHVIEAITGLMESAQNGSMYEMKTTCARPKGLDLGTVIY